MDLIESLSVLTKHFANASETSCLLGDGLLLQIRRVTEDVLSISGCRSGKSVIGCRRCPCVWCCGVGNRRTRRGKSRASKPIKGDHDLAENSRWKITPCRKCGGSGLQSAGFDAFTVGAHQLIKCWATNATMHEKPTRWVESPTLKQLGSALARLNHHLIDEAAAQPDLPKTNLYCLDLTDLVDYSCGKEGCRKVIVNGEICTRTVFVLACYCGGGLSTSIVSRRIRITNCDELEEWAILERLTTSKTRIGKMRHDSVAEFGDWAALEMRRAKELGLNVDELRNLQ